MLVLLALLYGTMLAGCGPAAVVTRSSPVDGKLMVRVTAGPFLMGTSPVQESDLIKKLNLPPNILGSEMPQATLALSEFYIDQTPVTNAEYKKFLDSDPQRDVPFTTVAQAQPANWDRQTRAYPPARAQYPVVLVSWKDASAYCRWAGKRLPTEAEWEKAARGSDGRLWPWGNDWDATRSNGAEQGLLDATPVGKYSAGASPSGALDMAGNVWQWTSTLDKEYPYQPADGREDTSASGMRVTRGGAFLFGAAFTRTAARNRFNPDGVSFSIGFRCAG